MEFIKKNKLFLLILGLSVNISSFSLDVGVNAYATTVVKVMNEQGVTVEVKEGKIFMRLNGHVKNEQAVLVIKNSNNITVFNREIEVTDNQIFKVFDQKTFESGTYSVSLITELTTLKAQFKI